jgi:hypothetical protein
MRYGVALLLPILGPSSALGVVTLGPEAGVTSLHGDGVNRMNERLEDSEVMTVGRNHTVALDWGVSARWFDKTMNRAGVVAVSRSSDTVAAKGVGASTESVLSSTEVLAGYQMRLFPFANTIITPLSKGWSGRHLFILGGPLVGLDQVSHTYRLESRLDDTEIRYSASSLHGAGGAELLVGYPFTEQIHLLIGGRLLYSVPLQTKSSVQSFRVRQEDLRFRASDLEVERLTGSTIQSWSASATIQVGI